MEQFTWKASGDADYVGLKIGEKIIGDNDKTIEVAGIVKVYVRQGFVYVIGYGIVVDY